MGSIVKPGPSHAKVHIFAWLASLVPEADSDQDDFAVSSV